MLYDVTESSGEHFFRVTDCRNYVAQKNMRKNVVWGTTVEIFAAATLLKTEIYISTRTAKDRAPCWLRYTPLELKQIGPNLAPGENAIFIAKLYDHFQPVFSVKC